MNTSSRHAQLPSNEKFDRSYYWSLYLQGVSRISWEICRTYFQRFCFHSRNALIIDINKVSGIAADAIVEATAIIPLTAENKSKISLNTPYIVPLYSVGSEIPVTELDANFTGITDADSNSSNTPVVLVEISFMACVDERISVNVHGYGSKDAAHLKPDYVFRLECFEDLNIAKQAGSNRSNIANQKFDDLFCGKSTGQLLCARTEDCAGLNISVLNIRYS